MSRWVALLRGINVGGRNKLPMKDLSELLTNAGFENLATYIQSGNVVFTRKGASEGALAAKISSLILSEFGINAPTVVVSADRLAKAMAANPFPEAEADPTFLHLVFLAATPRRPDLGALRALAGKREKLHLSGKVFYLHAPDGLARSKVAARAETLLRVSATARNWRTVCKLLELARA